MAHRSSNCLGPALPAQSEVQVRPSLALHAVPAIVTRPLLSAALSQRGFVFERHRFRARDLVPGRLMNPLVIFPLTEGIEARWRPNGAWQRARTRRGAFVSFPAGAELLGHWRGALDALVFSFDLGQSRRHFPEVRILPYRNLRPEANVADAQLWHLALAEKAELEAGCPTGNAYTGAIAEVMSLSLMLRHGAAVREIDGANPAAARLRGVLTYISDRIDEDLSLQALAALAGMSTDGFRRFFTKTIGVTPHRYILQQRIERAKRLLSRPGLSMAEIAYGLGFSSQAHFSTTFRKFVGCSPKVYQNRSPR